MKTIDPTPPLTWNCCANAAMPDLKQYQALVLKGVAEDEHGNCHVVTSGEPVCFYSVYGVLRDSEEVEPLHDFPTGYSNLNEMIEAVEKVAALHDLKFIN